MQDKAKQIETENQVLKKQLNELYSRFEDKILELSTVKEFGSIIQHISSFEKTCLSILEVILKNTIAQNCSIMLLDPESEQLYLVAASDPNGNSRALEAVRILSRKNLDYRFKVGQGAAGKAVLDKKPILVEDLSCSPYAFAGSSSAVPIGSLLSLPLVSDDKVLGVINISHKEKSVFQPNDVRLFSILCDIIALLILNSLGHERLKGSEEKYRVLAESSSDGISIIQNGLHVYANPKYAQITGHTVSELETLPLSSVFSIPSDNPHGSVLGLLQDEEASSRLWEAHLVKRGNSLEEVEINASATTHGGKRAIILSVRDLTERRLLERQLRQAQKMEAVGTLAAGIAHDFNNLLQGIQGYADLILRKLQREGIDHSTQELRRIVQTVRRGSGLTRQLLTFGREIESNPHPMDLNQAVTQAAELLQRTIPKMIKVQFDLLPGLSPIHADPVQVEQVIMNIALNARDAMPNGGKLHFGTRHVTMDDSFCRSNLGAKPGSYVCLKISDTGQGIPGETLEHIFEPFFTTKEVGKGTGLGLAMVYGIVKNHNGYVKCSSEVDRGTTFDVFFPAAVGEELKAQDDEGKEPESSGGRETILVVDDEEMVRELVGEMLSDYGYEVLTSVDGEEALEAYRSRTAPIHLVILDLNMPGMGGDQCLAELLKIDPEARVLIASGYSPHDSYKVALQAGARGFLSKPYEMSQMLKTIRELLDE